MFKADLKAALAAGVISAAVAGLAHAALPQTITVDGEKVFPQSMTSAADGSVFFGSIGNKMIYRAAPGSDRAVAFVQPGTDSVQSTFGVYADSKTNTLVGLLKPARATGDGGKLEKVTFDGNKG